MPEVLSYRSAPKRPPPKDPKWTAKRVAYYFALLGWFSLIAFWAGPNVWLFGRVTGMRESDLHEQALRLHVPVIRATLEYVRDFGTLPPSQREVRMVYFGLNTALPWGSGDIRYQRWIGRDYSWGQTIFYDFSHPESPWSSTGIFYKGPINLPPVTLDMPFNPSTRPTTDTTSSKP